MYCCFPCGAFVSRHTLILYCSHTKVLFLLLVSVGEKFSFYVKNSFNCCFSHIMPNKLIFKQLLDYHAHRFVYAMRNEWMQLSRYKETLTKNQKRSKLFYISASIQTLYLQHTHNSFATLISLFEEVGTFAFHFLLHPFFDDNDNETFSKRPP